MKKRVTELISIAVDLLNIITTTLLIILLYIGWTNPAKIAAWINILLNELLKGVQ